MFQLSKLTKQTLLVISITNLYMVLGGIIFSVIEKKHIDEICESYKDHVANKLPGIFLQIHSSGQENTGNIDFSPLIELVENATSAGFKVVYNNSAPSAKVICPNKWDYWNGILFSATVMTTIGYGSKSPETNLGQFIYMVYSIIGITLFAVYSNVLSKTFLKLHKWIVLNITKKYFRNFGKKSMGFLWLVLFLLIFMVGPSLLFLYIESDSAWTFFGCIYFCFTTLTTIGFGDMVPAQMDSSGGTG